MLFHRNAKLGLAGRYALVCAIGGGMTLKAAAAAFSVSPATAHRWWHRWLDATDDARATLSCLFDRSSRPRRSPRQLAPELAEAICSCRRRTGWGPRLVAGATGFCHSTVWKVLRRAGLSRAPRPVREPANRYEWPCPGDLLHMDTSEYARFQRPGHRVTGDRSTQDRQHQDGVDVVHAIIDDHSRLAYAEIHPDAKQATVVGFLKRALHFYAAHAITPRRLMTDNAWAYARSRLVRETLAREHIRHLITKPYRPRTNGKVERFHQTMAREWAYGLVYQSHHDRAAALPHWLHHYNTARPHSSLGGRPPISRVHNVCGQDI
jgi:transposase InsO family protein